MGESSNQASSQNIQVIALFAGAQPWHALNLRPARPVPASLTALPPAHHMSSARLVVQLISMQHGISRRDEVDPESFDEIRSSAAQAIKSILWYGQF
jgi:hypothetical protein